MYTVSTLAPPKPDIGVSAPTTQLGMDCIVEISCNASTETPIWVDVSAVPYEKRSDTSLQSEQRSNSPHSFLCALLPRFSFGHRLGSCAPTLRCSHVATSRHTANRHEVICAVIQIFYRVGTSLRLVGTNVCGFYCRKFTLFVSVRWFVAFRRHTCKSDRQ